MLAIPNRPLRLLLPAAALLAAAGCGDARFEAELASPLYAAPVRAAPPAATVDAGHLPDPSTAVRVDAGARLFSLGAPDGDERLLFGRVADLALGAGGDTLYVLDRMQREVKAFSREGAFLFRFGRRGKGPGEYEEPVSIALLPWSGQLAVWDLKLQRLTFVTPGGETVRTVRPVPQGDLAYLGKKLRAWRGGLVLELNDDALVVAPERQRGYLVALDTLGQVRDTVLDFAIPPIRGSGVTDRGRVILAQWDYSPYWTPDPEWDVHPGGEIVFAPGGRYEVFRFTPGGRPLLRVTRPWRPERITRAERLANIRGSQDHPDGYDKRIPPFVLEFTERDAFAVLRPGVTDIRVAPGGATLVRRFDVGDHWEGRSRIWDAYRPDGTPDGSIRFPGGFHPRVLGRDHVYGLRQDTLGVDYVEAYRLRAGEPVAGVVHRGPRAGSHSPVVQRRRWGG